MPLDEGRGWTGGRCARPAAPPSLPDSAGTRQRRVRGAIAYRAGLAAEDQVVALYRHRGFEIAATRWRGKGGEIDIIARQGATLVFIEVKRGDTFATAADHLTARQIGRLCAAASEFIGNEPGGQDTDMRFDVALVDGCGNIDVVEGAIGF